MSQGSRTLTDAECLDIERKIDRLTRSGSPWDAIDLASCYVNSTHAPNTFHTRAHYLRAYTQFLAGLIVDASESIEFVLPHLSSMPAEFRAHALVLSIDIFLAAKRWQDSARLLAEVAEVRKQLDKNRNLEARYYRVLLIGRDSHLYVRAAQQFVRRLVNEGFQREAACLSADLCRYHERNGNLSEAQRCLSIGLALNSQVPTVKADLLIQSGRHLQMRGELQSAFDAYTNASQARAGPLQSGEAKIRAALVQWDMNQRTEAVQTLRQAVDELRQPIPTLLQPLVGYAYSAFGLTRASAVSLEEVSEDASGTVPAEQRALRQGAEMQSAGLNEDARTWYMQAWKTANQNNNAEVAWRAALAIGRLMTNFAKHSDCGESEAVRWLEQALSILEKQAKTIHQPVNRTHYRYQLRNIVMELLDRSVKQEVLPDTFHYLELMRGRLLSDFVQSTLQNRRRGFSGWLTFLRNRLHTGGRRSGLKRFRSQLRANELYASIFLLPQQLVVLAACSDRAPWLYTVDIDSTRLLLARQMFLSEVESQLNHYRNGKDIEVHRQHFLNRLDEFAQAGPIQILRHLLEITGKTTWLLSLDSTLAAIPWHGLSVNGLPLVKTVDVCYLPYARLIEEIKPVRRIRKQTRGLVVAENNHVLPSAAAESKAIKQCFPKTICCTGADASLSQITNSASQATFVHFACHAETCTESPLNARILLPSGEFWSAEQVAKTQIQTGSLAVLNCCKTAEQQKLVSGELFSMAASFLSSGASAAIAALWSLPDQEAAQVIAHFYDQLLKNRPLHAICETQRFAFDLGMHPLFWTPFVYMGNPR